MRIFMIFNVSLNFSVKFLENLFPKPHLSAEQKLDEPLSNFTKVKGRAFANLIFFKLMNRSEIY